PTPPWSARRRRPPRPRGGPRTPRRAAVRPRGPAEFALPSSRARAPSSRLRSAPAADDRLAACPLCTPVRGRQLPRDTGHHDTTFVEEPGFQAQRALVVQDLLP